MRTYKLERIEYLEIAISDAEYELILNHAIRYYENWMFEDKVIGMNISWIKFIRKQHNIGLKQAKDIVDEIFADANKQARQESFTSLGALLRNKLQNPN